MKKIIIGTIISTFAVLSITGCGVQINTEDDNKNNPDKSGTYSLDYVIDGDTVVFKGLKRSIRLVGIDTPESKASIKMLNAAKQCTDGNVSAMKLLGHKASDYTKSLIFKDSLYELKHIDTGKYQRIVGDIVVKNKSLSLQIVEAGYATVYPGYSKISPALKDIIQDAYLTARSKGKGLWGEYPKIMECLNP